MFFNFRVFIHSLLFFLILELALDEVVLGFMMEFFESTSLLISIFVVFFLGFVFRATLRFGKDWRMTPTPLLFAATAVGLIFFVDSPEKRQTFILLISFLYYLGQIGNYRLAGCKTDQTARGILASMSLASIFLFYSFFYAVYLNFAVSLWLMMVVFFSITSLVTMQYLQLIKKNTEEAWKFSLIIGLVMMEISWVAHFWPFGYLTTAATMLIFYYVFWDLARSYFLENLSKRRVVSNMIFFGALAGVVMMSSRWLPII